MMNDEVYLVSSPVIGDGSAGLNDDDLNPCLTTQNTLVRIIMTTPAHFTGGAAPILPSTSRLGTTDNHCDTTPHFVQLTKPLSAHNSLMITEREAMSLDLESTSNLSYSVDDNDCFITTLNRGLNGIGEISINQTSKSSQLKMNEFSAACHYSEVINQSNPDKNDDVIICKNVSLGDVHSRQESDEENLLLTSNNHNTTEGSSSPAKESIIIVNNTGETGGDTVMESSYLHVDQVKGLVYMKIGDLMYQFPLASASVTEDGTINAKLQTLNVQTDTSASVEGIIEEADSEWPPVDGAMEVVTDQDDGKTKRRGGWPKGKKRKLDLKDGNCPRAPMTAYVLYCNDHRKQVTADNPHLPFSRITKLLGQEWSALSQPAKQAYMTAAAQDKERYIRELNDYQKSESYCNFLKKKRKLKDMKDALTAQQSNHLPHHQDDQNDNGEDVDEEVDDDDEEESLHCKVCNKYFYSVHNKKEHLLGQKHLKAVKDDYEELLRQKQTKNDKLTSLTNAIHQLESDDDENSKQSSQTTEVDDVSIFMESFLKRNADREQEILELKRTLAASRSKHFQLCKELVLIKDIAPKLEEEIDKRRNYSASMMTLIDSLKMVPTLFGVINF